MQHTKRHSDRTPYVLNPAMEDALERRANEFLEDPTKLNEFMSRHNLKKGHVLVGGFLWSAFIDDKYANAVIHRRLQSYANGCFSARERTASGIEVAQEKARTSLADALLYFTQTYSTKAPILQFFDPAFTRYFSLTQVLKSRAHNYQAQEKRQGITYLPTGKSPIVMSGDENVGDNPELGSFWQVHQSYEEKLEAARRLRHSEKVFHHDMFSALLAHLKPEFQQVLELYERQNWEQKDIAHLLGVTPKTISRRYKAAKEALSALKDEYKKLKQAPLPDPLEFDCEDLHDVASPKCPLCENRLVQKGEGEGEPSPKADRNLFREFSAVNRSVPDRDNSKWTVLRDIWKPEERDKNA